MLHIIVGIHHGIVIRILCVYYVSVIVSMGVMFDGNGVVLLIELALLLLLSTTGPVFVLLMLLLLFGGAVVAGAALFITFAFGLLLVDIFGIWYTVYGITLI